MSRRRGFTLIELVVYLGLVATALLVFGGIEVSAHRNLAVQSALIDMENQSASYLGALRPPLAATQRALPPWWAAMSATSARPSPTPLSCPSACPAGR